MFMTPLPQYDEAQLANVTARPARAPGGVLQRRVSHRLSPVRQMDEAAHSRLITGARIMLLTKLVYVTQFVKDQDKALDFYTNVVGFEKRVDNPTTDGPRFLTVAIEGQDFQLVLWPGTPGRAQPVQGRVPATCTIETPNCRAAFEALKSRGVKFETEVLEYPWGYIAVFEDPDGNRLQLREGRR
jgi:predicted enzyme related to lactoylglutathione lyase